MKWVPDNDLIMYGKIVVVFSLLGLSVTSAQFLQDGQCDPNLTLQANFNAAQFSGNWYEVGRSTNRDGGDCSGWTISTTDNTNFVITYNVVNKNIRDEKVYQASLQTGTARFNLTNYGGNGESADLWILNTNYQDYAIAYRCENVGTTQRNIYITHLGRQTEINPIFNNAMNNAVTPLGISLSDLRTVNFSEESCFALPSFESGQPIILPGQCDNNISLLSTFDAARFTGTWYEIYSYYSENALGDCSRADYSLGDGVVNVVNSQVVNQTLESFTGTAEVVEGTTGMLIVRLELLPGVFGETYLWVIDTNYEDYAISYSCTNLENNTKRVFSWIASRTREQSAEAQIAVNRVVDSIQDLNFAYYQPNNLSAEACFYYPEPSTDSVVEFRGECDLTIPAVPDFDPTRYIGLWHDIESYPTGFQGGECNNALYSLGDVGVDVFNTQVINQTLDTMTGEARLVSDDGSAKLAVTFPVVGTNFTVTTSYWVLATDYVSYSLVYTCEYNSFTDTRQVYSWKLSRTKSLTAEANIAINNVTANIDVLDQRYYIQRDQSPEACFYYPEPQRDVPVVFPGVCDQNITTVQNFNLISFAGTWYEIETYPKEQSGECVQHQYTVGAGTTLNLVSNFILDQFEASSSSILSFSSIDSSGRSIMTINVGTDQAIQIPFWILDTDYISYALAYSCMERARDNDYRAVYAWKLSRNQQQLPAAAETEINSVMENIDVLDQRYFEDVDQTATGCTPLPNIAAGQPVILEGQCDPNIQVVQNFDAGAYIGRWFLIESYWSEFQDGTCNDATYSAQEDGSVLVFNTQVINRTLDTITGRAEVSFNDGSAKLNVTFPTAPFPTDYWVIDTDYTSYALVYTCVNLANNQQQIWSWKMSRTKSLTDEAVEKINRAVSNVYPLNNRFYYTIDNSDAACFYFPEANGEPLVFRGQCDESIPVVTNFDAVAYMGLWYDIESYPQLFQDGVCGTAFYTLTDVVEVFNTQVLNKRLDTITGSAIPLQSENGEAKLNVSFPIEVAPGIIADTLSPYWVLATDYTSYALVYSCQNIGEDQRSVSSWKLSRERTLSTQAQNSINEVINRIDVLSNDYYEVQGHTDEDCFYYPEPTNEPVVFRGQCNDSIQAMPNFDLSRFAGTWNEIATYPKEQAGGQCISHEFGTTTTNTILSLTSNQVFNSDTLVSNDGQIALSSTDGSGRFVLTINVNNQVITIPYWIIDTDYTNYALVYSCMNRDEETRAVYSWKLSRSTVLSNNANNLIAEAMTAVDVLDEQYYVPVSHTEESCFYYPEVGPNEPVIFPGQCDLTIPVVQNFSAGNYLGRWHLIETYYSAYQDGDCNDATYSANEDGSVLVFNTQVINQTLDTITGVARVVSTDGSAKLQVQFPDAPFPSDYWVVDTDYESFALVYSCFNLDNNRQQVWGWKMSRTRSLTPEAVARINQKVDEIRVLDNRYFNVINNTDAACFYFPEPNGQPVIFRGQCDESVPVVTNFDAVGYMGLWYDIESYPQLFQDGVCGTAFYTLTDVVEVFNTQVLNKRLDTITGFAIPLQSENGEAKLNVSFPIEVAPGIIADTLSPYWVLATDYTSYALVYSCQNIGEDQRSVSSWKLSRERTLSTQAQNSINEVINRIDVLSSDYYEVQGHNDEDCFYYPEPTNEPVVFRGQCNDSIQAMPNFDLSRFAGTWNEIATYPKEQAGGQCISHEFGTTTTNTILSLTSNQVFNSDTLVSNDGQIALSSTDGSGRFVLTINVNNQVITIPYWIIDTDYTNYALVYSCMNRDEETRAVYSWKLSRSTVLSNNANNLIAEAMTAVDVLDEQYYVPVSHTEESCFYYPEVGPNEPVIFPGQCDLTIPVVQNFSAGDYLGRWHLIETYYSAYQDGDCNDATYSANEDGSVLVFNTQVINQTLDTITGVARVVSTDGSAKLSVQFPDAPFPSDYWVVDTDYESFALVYSCFNLDNNRQQVWGWKMSRTRSLTPEAVARINQKVDEIRVLDNRYFNVINNTDAACFYFPEPNGQPVIFRGQCDESVPVVTNFDAVGYMGLWYDIESYPQEFQEGVCGTAFYTLTNVVEVFNTQVVNKRLDTITGSAIPLESEIGEAKLNVTFPIEVAPGVIVDVYSPYWVLATDYNTYALVYSCQNIGEDQRYVATWKLSRERTLSTQAQNSINEVINRIDVLSNDYYQVQGHTDEDCFYFPEPTNEPVVFRGQCDDSIQAMSNFNVTRFAGVWNEIETYPKEQAGGQCINHEFTTSTTSNNILQLISNQVFDSERLVSNNGQLILNSNDGSGRFSLTINVNNQAFTIPYWIIDTDYDNYAIVYSCMNRDAETRAVYSWKLSRSKEISNSANSAINAAIETIDVLDQQYYQPVSQTDASCFYLPDQFNLNEPIILTGQCDRNIPVIGNFNAEQFAGRWFDIESYFDDYTGSCVDQNYVLNNNVYTVTATQVVNQTLDVTNSAATISADSSGRLTVSSNGVESEYWILDTDYEDWALIYSCQNVNDNQRRVRSWKMSRSRQLSTAANTTINRYIEDINVLNQRFYITRDHSEAGCFYFPVPDGKPVTFRGRCDDTISVVQQFDVAAYLGQWYDIESYPQEFQEGGQCSTALYTLGENGVDVFNTQVVNQQLDVINGLAVVASTDDSAKLAVTFDFDNPSDTSPYWVLSTDYNSYSLVYSCAEIDDEYKRVSAWKISRTRSLTAEAEQQINQVMSNIPELRDEYFRKIGHSEEDCFFYPENNGGPVILSGQCPNADEVEAVTNFNINSFSGTWYEVSRFPSELQTGECASSEFAINGQGIGITKNIIYNERLIVATGDGTTSSDGRGIISASLTGDQFNADLNMYILDTDYNEFALLYACRNIDSTSKQIYSWQMSRSQSGLSEAAKDRINSTVSENRDLFELYYETTQQNNDACFFYPNFTTTPVVIELPGPCDESIKGVAQFSAGDYLGRWFEIARYPQPWQFGACDQATYSLGDGVVDVYNTQVVNRTLLIQEGFADVVSVDGTGQLLVTFDVQGVTNTANYYILATDYTSYSLVYSCRNLDNGNREVSSWKLSRSRTLSAAANQAMDAIIADTQGLLEEYYIPTSQSDESCFYVPEPNPDTSVVFRGQCGDVSGMQGFNIQNYLGIWHEVERYPTGQDDGVCSNANFRTTGTNQFQVVDTSIFGVSASIGTSTVTVTANGRIRRTSGQNTTDVYVLATDYTTYALLYSCENVDDEYRRVWSAKHSRTRSLPTAAENEIAAAMATNDLLYQEHFVEVDQSDDACFFYPEVTGRPVVMPGQCDQNIPVMQNFALEEYTGTWYQTERYPQFWETGNCTGARYTMADDVVEVLNWQVIDGELDTIEGTAEPIYDDGTARFKVVLPSRAVDAEEGDTVETDLYVLTTDYVTYSLTYSCVNINEYERQLGVWKLSRTKEMPQSGNSQINNYIAQRQELDQRYFVSVGQDDDCEEPNSSYLVKSSILMLLVCSILHLLK